MVGSLIQPREELVALASRSMRRRGARDDAWAATRRHLGGREGMRAEHSSVVAIASPSVLSYS